jgi:hypothetical protein
MKPVQKIADLEKEIAIQQKIIDTCNHDWDQPIYEPEIVKEASGFKTVGQGSDVWTQPEGYHNAEKSRWSRECKICGHKQYTNKLNIVDIKTEPKF